MKWVICQMSRDARAVAKIRHEKLCVVDVVNCVMHAGKGERRESGAALRCQDPLRQRWDATLDDRQ